MTGLWIPDEILRIDGLDFLSKGLYSQIIALSETKPCYASNSYFAELFGVSTRTISSCIANLERIGFITYKIDKVNGNSRIIIPMENSSIPMEKFSSHIKEENKVENKVENKLKTNSIDRVLKKSLESKKEKAPHTGAPPNESNFPFEIIWGMYGKKGSAKVSKQRYEKLKENIREVIFEHVPRYVASTPELKFRKNFEVYLNQETYNDQIIEHGSSSTKTVYRSSKNESSEQYLGRVGSELDEIFERRFGKSSNEASDTASYEFDQYTDFKDV